MTSERDLFSRFRKLRDCETDEAQVRKAEG